MAGTSIMDSLFFLSVVALICTCNRASIPIVLNTWEFPEATLKAWSVFSNNGSAVDAIEQGGSECEIFGKCSTSVGYGGHPDEIGETTLDAMIMDGTTHDVGAVGDLRRVKSAISVARAVMEYTTHTFLVGDSATNFAVQMGFKQSNLHSNISIEQFKAWRAAHCQPNHRQNVLPDPTLSCGPYRPDGKHAGSKLERNKGISRDVDETNHDTIGLLAIDGQGNIAGGTTTNGLGHKVPGRVGDSPIAGAGAYVDKDAGGAACTGDGDIMMRFVPSYQTVAYMADGLSPGKAAERSINRILKYYPTFSGAIIAVNMKGEHGAACHSITKYLADEFRYCVRSADMTNVTLYSIPCVTQQTHHSSSYTTDPTSPNP